MARRRRLDRRHRRHPLLHIAFRVRPPWTVCLNHLALSLGADRRHRVHNVSETIPDVTRWHRSPA